MRKRTRGRGKCIFCAIFLATQIIKVLIHVLNSEDGACRRGPVEWFRISDSKPIIVQPCRFSTICSVMAAIVPTRVRMLDNSGMWPPIAFITMLRGDDSYLRHASSFFRERFAIATSRRIFFRDCSYPLLVSSTIRRKHLESALCDDFRGFVTLAIVCRARADR